MTPIKCHSQPTPCAYKGALARGDCVPLRTPATARLSPARGRAAGVAPLLPGGALTADSPHRGCRRPRVVGEARRPPGAAGVACARPWPGQWRRFRPRWLCRSGGRRDHRLAAAIIAPHKGVAGRRRPRLVLPTIDQPVPEGSVTKAALVEQVAYATGLTKKRAETIVDTVFGNISEELQQGEKVELRGFGSFGLWSRQPRRGRNPRTGDRVDVPPKHVAYFKPGKELKELINREPAQAAPPLPD